MFSPFFHALLFFAIIVAVNAQIPGPDGSQQSDDDLASPPAQVNTTTPRGGVQTPNPPVDTGTSTTPTTTRSPPTPTPTTSTSPRPITTSTSTTRSSTSITTSTSTTLTTLLPTSDETSTGATLIVNPTFTPLAPSNTFFNTFVPPTSASTSEDPALTAGTSEVNNAPAPSGFLQNKTAMGITFTFLALIILAGVFSLVAFIMRRRRNKRLDDFTHEAGWGEIRERHATSTFGFNDHEHYPEEQLQAKRDSTHSEDSHGIAAYYSQTAQPSAEPLQSNYRFPPAAPPSNGAYLGQYGATSYSQGQGNGSRYPSPYGTAGTGGSRYPFNSQYANSSQPVPQQSPALPAHYAPYAPASNQFNQSGYAQSRELNPVREPSVSKRAGPSAQTEYGTAW